MKGVFLTIVVAGVFVSLLFSGPVVLADGPDYEERVVVVQKGDTLASLAERYFGVWSRYRELMVVNALNTTVIYPGQVLVLPVDWPVYNGPFSDRELDLILTNGWYDPLLYRSYSGNFYQAITSTLVHVDNGPRSFQWLPSRIEIYFGRQAKVVYPLGIRWSPEDSALYFSGASRLSYGGGELMTPSYRSGGLVVSETSPSRSFISPFYDSRTKRLYRWLLKVYPNPKGGAIVEVLSVWIDQLERIDPPVVSDCLDDYPGRVPAGSVAWVSGEQVTVTAVFTSTCSIPSDTPSPWKVYYSSLEGVEITRQIGEKLIVTGFNIGLEDQLQGWVELGPWQRSKSPEVLVGRLFYVAPWTEVSGVLHLDSQDPAPLTPEFELYHIKNRWEMGQLDVSVGVISGTVPFTTTSSEGEVYVQWHAIGLQDGSTLMLGAGSKPPDGSRVLIFTYNESAPVGSRDVGKIMALVSFPFDPDTVETLNASVLVDKALQGGRLWYFNHFLESLIEVG